MMNIVGKSRCKVEIKSIRLVIVLFFLSLSIGAYPSVLNSPKKANPYGEKILTKKLLFDKVKGGWAGKTIGCTYGGPVEFQFNGTMVQDYIPIKWNNDRIKWYYDNAPGLYDDVYVDLSFVAVIDKLGIEAPADSFAVAFARHDFPLWHANQAARYNILNGIMPPASGYWKNNPHADDIDFQIEADFAGIMTPGMPNACSDITDKVGHIMNYGDGWYGGVFVASMYTQAYISNDVNYIVSESLKKIPANSKFYRCISDVIKWHKAFPNDWKRTWYECQKKWSNDIGCPDGIFSPFDIDALINSAYVTIGLLYGQGNFGKSIEIAARCGQDADCNPSTVAGILGVMLGYSNIPVYWKDPLKSVEDRSFSHSSYSLNTAYQASYNHALMMIKKEGGKIADDVVTLKCQQPVPVRYEQSFEGLYPKDKVNINRNLEKDKSLDFDFTGKGVAFRGGISYSADKDYVAKVKVIVDGKDLGVVKLPAAENKRNQNIFWKYDLQDGSHKISFKWMNPESKVQIYVGDALLYKSTSVVH